MRLNTYYDLKFAPATFDFGTYLVVSNAVRQSIGAETMGVTIVCDSFREKSQRELTTTKSELSWRINHILTKLPFLIPEIDSLTINKGGLEDIKLPFFPGGYPPAKDMVFPYTADNLIPFYGTGINLRPYKASEQARSFINNAFDDNVITISLRNSKFQPARNSNLEEWYKVYQELKASKFRPIVLPCFEDYMTERLFAKYDWEIYEPALLDLDLRLALYEKAKDNLCINNGVIIPLIHSDCRYHIFKWLTDGIPTCSIEWNKKVWGINYGENFQFSSSSGQHLVWEDDDAHLILKALNL